MVHLFEDVVLALSPLQLSVLYTVRVGLKNQVAICVLTANRPKKYRGVWMREVGVPCKPKVSPAHTPSRGVSCLALRLR